MNKFYIILFLVSCSAVDPNAEKEVLPKGITTLDQSLEELVEKAQEHYSNELYSIAVDEFDKIATNFPGSPYQELAELKIADGKFEQGLYSEASIGYDSFINNHPGSKDVEYATFRKALSAYTSAPKPGRNQFNTELALKTAKEFINKYPKSEYKSEIVNIIRDCNDKLYEHELEIIKYLEKTSPDAYQIREQELKNKYK